MPRSGADLALLLLGGFRALAHQANAELAARGYEDVRPVHDFALRAIMAGASNASDLGRRTAVTKQAAAKTIAVLEDRGYVAREPDPADGRRMRLIVTGRGLEMLSEGEKIFDEMRAQWEKQVGAERVSDVEATLRALLGDHPIDLDNPGGPPEA